MKILHVAESFGGGVATAMGEYVQSTPEADHYLLRGDRTQVVPDAHRHYVWSRPLGSGVSAIRAIRTAVRELQPDVVHAQSSFAGVYVRLAVNARSVRVVYTPHCFAFERLDIPPVSRSVYRLVERVLAFNTTVLAGCSPFEAGVGRRWLGSDKAIYVPNVARVEPQGVPAARTTDKPLIVGLGRLDAQKDPSWFAEVAEIIGDRADLLWIGGGHPDQEERLRSAGVRLTGWVSREQAMEQLAVADCFIMTSRWEGFPMAVLEANALNVPVVLRRLPALPDAPELAIVDTPDQAAARSLVVAFNEGERAANLDRWADYLAENSPLVQRERLLEAYGMTSKPSARR